MNRWIAALFSFRVFGPAFSLSVRCTYVTGFVKRFVVVVFSRFPFRGDLSLVQPSGSAAQLLSFQLGMLDQPFHSAMFAPEGLAFVPLILALHST